MNLFNSTNSHDMFRKAIVELKLNGIIAEYVSKFLIVDLLMLLKHMLKLLGIKTLYHNRSMWNKQWTNCLNLPLIDEQIDYKYILVILKN